jgi:hypothetical protein
MHDESLKIVAMITELRISLVMKSTSFHESVISLVLGLSLLLLLLSHPNPRTEINWIAVTDRL